MAIQRITYDDKVAINNDTSVPDINKCKADDLNEIKNVVNNNANEIPTTDYLVNVYTSVDTDYRVNFLSSRNLFDKNNINKLNAYFESSGGAIIENDYNRVLYIPCTPNTDYTFTQGTSSISNHIFQVATTTTKPEINTIVYDFVDKTNYSTFTYTTNATAKYLVIRIRGGDDVDTFYNGVQIEKGDIASPYEPFIQKTINVDDNKFTDTINVGTEVNSANRVNVLYSHNLLDLSNTQTSLGITSDYNKETGAFSFSGTSSSTYSDLTSYTDCYLPIGTYTFSLNRTFTKNFHLLLKFDDNTTTDINLEYGNTTISFTTSKVAIQQRIYVALNNNTAYNETFYIQLEKGDTSTTFNRYIGSPSIVVDEEEIYNAKYNNPIKMWSGSVYTQNDEIVLTEKLEIGGVYLINFLGNSSVYRNSEIFIYTGTSQSPNLVQINYYSYPDSVGFRYRLRYNDDLKITLYDVNNGASNRAIKEIYRIK